MAGVRLAELLCPLAAAADAGGEGGRQGVAAADARWSKARVRPRAVAVAPGAGGGGVHGAGAGGGAAHLRGEVRGLGDPGAAAGAERGGGAGARRGLRAVR